MIAQRLRKLPRTPHRYEFVAFLSGFAVLVLELSGARLIAPFFGTSTYIWTAIIGIILGSLALGNLLGGRLADSRDPAEVIKKVLLGGAAAIMLMAFTQQQLLSSLATLGLDVRLAACLAASVLFAVPSLLIGVVYPCLAKLQVTSLAHAGESIGRLEAAGTLGSISGTFMTGYVFLGFFGSKTIVIGVGLLVLVTAIVAGVRLKSRPALTILVAGLLVYLFGTIPVGTIADVDTKYARYQVHELLYGDQVVRALVTDNRGIQSAVSKTNPTQPVFSYIQRFYDLAEQVPSASKILIIGGGSYSFPLALANNDSTKRYQRIDVVEIDAGLEKLAKDYFYFEDSPQIRIFNEDGRTYLNANAVKYGLIYMDAYNSISPPFQLTTTETVERLVASLESDGIVAANIISDYQAGDDDYLTAMHATYRQHFKYVSLFSANQLPPGSDRTNFILTATNSLPALAGIKSALGSGDLAVDAGGQVLTDDFAPVERLTY